MAFGLSQDAAQNTAYIIGSQFHSFTERRDDMIRYNCSVSP